ncbi:MAG: hypothetical protein M1838_004530, partial [Thelocarpon superellum]
FMAYGLLTDQMLSLRYGLGKHLLAGTIEGVENYLKSLYAYLFLYSLCLYFVKLSLLVFYKQIFPSRGFRIAWYIVVAFNTLVTLTALLVAIFQCRPISGFWDKSFESTCIDSYAFLLAEGALTITSDVIVLIMPMPMVWRLQISSRQKLALTGIFVLGSFVTVASIIRITTLGQVFTLDSTWNVYDPDIWTVIEVNLAIVCACLPIMRPLLRRARPNTTSQSVDPSRSTRSRHPLTSVPEELLAKDGAGDNKEAWSGGGDHELERGTGGDSFPDLHDTVDG